MLQALIFIVMIRTSHRQLRAYIFAEVDMGDQPQLNFDAGARFALRGRNRGQTPAYRVSQVISCEVFPFPLVGKLPPAETTEPPAFHTIGPTADILLFGQLTRPFTQTERVGLLYDTMRIYVYGEIRYRDAFALWRGCGGTRQPRYTRFRYMISLNSMGRPEGILVAPDGNNAN